jgi:hypothetical protein
MFQLLAYAKELEARGREDSLLDRVVKSPAQLMRVASSVYDEAYQPSAQDKADAGILGLLAAIGAIAAGAMLYGRKTVQI